VPYLVKAPRVGRSQGAVIFWGLVSVFFATAFCYYFLKNRTNEENSRTLRDQVMILQGERDSLSSERDKIEAASSETEKQLKTREDFLQEKETKLADEETQLESMGQQSQSRSLQNQAQAAVVKKFDDTVRKLVAKTQDADVVVRGGRPVLRVPSSIFFAPGDAKLKPEGKAMLSQIAGALSGQLDDFELRIETFTDSDGEAGKSDAATGPKVFVDTTTPGQAPAAAAKTSPPPPANPHEGASWSLTGIRAAAIAHFLHDQGTLPFQNVLVMGRSDFQPIVANSPEGHARNRRVEITVTPLPPSFHPRDPVHGDSAVSKSAAPANPLDPPADAALKGE
jgi:chemotaxis protein MotB